MDIYEALYTTRAMRRLKPDPIPYDVQARILDAAIRAPHIGEGWRFILVDDPEIKSQLAPLYRQGMERMIGAPLDSLVDMMKDSPAMVRTVRSGVQRRLRAQPAPGFGGVGARAEEGARAAHGGRPQAGGSCA